MIQRVHYFEGQFLTSDDFKAEQEYLRNMRRRHNRLLHGWGTVCGLMVEPHPRPDNTGNEPWKVKITPGYVLDPYGHEIFIDDREVLVDLRKEGPEGLAVAPCTDQPEPECSEAEVEREPGKPLYVALKYAECKSRPVPVLVDPACDETRCEYSRIRESFAIKVLTTCPESHRNPPEVSLHKLAKVGDVRPCPGRPSEPWVVLAKVVPGRNGQISDNNIFNYDFGGGYYRRMVVALGDLWRHGTEYPAGHRCR